MQHIGDWSMKMLFLVQTSWQLFCFHARYASATVSKMTATYLRRPPKYRRLRHQAEAGPRGKRVKKNLEEIKL